MDVSLKKIRTLNDDIGLGEYGVTSSIRYEIALEYLADQCDKSKMICEIGPGGVIAYLAKYSEAQTSAIVSPRESHWDDIYKDYGIHLHQWDLNESLDQEGLRESFDCIVFLETLEHLNRWPEHVLDDIHKLLKPGGVLLLSTPNLVRLSNRVRMLIGRPPNNPFQYTAAGLHHVREYTFSELKGFLPSKKWEVVDHSFELPHSFARSKFFRSFIYMFKSVIATIIFVKIIKK
jgi:SAM-dependent methyltransferase